MAPGGAALSPRAVRGLVQWVGLALSLARPLAAQTPVASDAVAGDTLTVIPEPGLERGGFHRRLFGEDYRYLWTAPLDIPVFDLATEGGGLTPVEEGGGLQTSTLRFEGGDGRDYVFRSLGKDPTKGLPEDIRRSGLGAVIRDQQAAAYPTAPLAASRLLDAAGVLHVTPRLGVMPDDEALGKFREKFAGLAGFLEERPRAGRKHEQDSFGAEDVEGTWDFFLKLEKSPTEQLDRRAFVRARLMDFLMGDWDRHVDQWLWARFKTKGEKVARWEPIPRDRDQVFSSYEGVLLGFVRKAVPNPLGTYDSTLAGDVASLTYNGRVLDRHLLGPVAPEVYDTVARELQQAITDSVIEHAIAALPPEHLARDSAWLAARVRARRDDLPRAAQRFAEMLSDDINLFGTRQNDVVRISRGGRALEVAIYASPDSAARDEAWLRRRTDRSLTHEVRVYLLDGDDSVHVSGEGAGGPSVFLVTGAGADRVHDESSGVRMELYDTDSIAVAGHRHDVRRRVWDADLPSEENTIPPRDYGRSSSVLPVLGYRSEYGVELGVAWSRTDYGFRAKPWLSRLSSRVSVATGSGGVRADLRYQRYKRMSRSHWEVLTRVSQLTQIGFFGFGNETATEDDANRDFNRVRNTQVLVRPSFIKAFGKRSDLEFGPALRYTDTRLDNDRLIGQLAPRGTPTYGMVGVRAEWNSNLRTVDSTGTRGWWFSGGGSVWPAVWDVESTIGEVHAVVSTVLPARSLPLRPELALRAGGRKVWGPYPYFDAALVGGSRTVRGLREQRYAGDAGVLGNAELRFELGSVNLFVPAHVGLLGLTDVGRVWLEGEESSKWHTGVGGGLWIWSFAPQNLVSVTVVNAEGRTGVYFTAGFMF